MFVSVCFMLAIGFVDWLDRGFVYIWEVLKYTFAYDLSLTVLRWLCGGQDIKIQLLLTRFLVSKAARECMRHGTWASLLVCGCRVCVCVYTNALWSAKSCVANLLMLPVGKAVYSSDLAGLTGGYNQYRVNIPPPPPPPRLYELITYKL